jgi:hypothetical protein
LFLIRYNAGASLASGRGLPNALAAAKDPARAAAFFALSAEQGYADGQFMYGLVLLRGLGGVKQDLHGAAAHLAAAAKQVGGAGVLGCPCLLPAPVARSWGSVCSPFPPGPRQRRGRG